MPCYCYIVECADGTYYTGWTTDPEHRVATHNKGRGAKYTKMRLPVKLVYIEEQPDRKTAMKRERAIKKMTRSKKQKLFS
jgi:putative endonuclease